MGTSGALVSEKIAYGRVGGNSGPHWRLRPAIRGEAIWGSAR